MGAMGGMGTGLPATIGAALATGKRVICVVGDGGFMLNMQELEVVKRLNLPIKYFVLNNGGYAAIKATQDSYFDGNHVGCTRESGLTLPDIRKVAEAFGINCLRVSTNLVVKVMVQLTLATDKPEIVDVRVPMDFTLAHRVKRVMVDGKPTSGEFGEVE
jgi:acetolactate synthase-1/2/3 large subunit